MHSIKKCRSRELAVWVSNSPRICPGPTILALPAGLQRDIHAFFGSYSNARGLEGELLFRPRSAETVDEACRRSSVGKLLPNALYVHRTALEALDPLLRVYEGCARAYLGTLDGANLVKVHRHSGKVSYLVYPDFETDPHPTLSRSAKLCRSAPARSTASITPPVPIHRSSTARRRF
jgi:DNA phosphorothioation-associated putative methyltransferase